jgi:DNA-directed RNA polymerase subunit K/omega
MIHRPAGVNQFEFVILSSLRAAQLIRGCVPRIDPGHKVVITAQMEVAAGKVVRAADAVLPPIGE